jgi:hypothetical protein
MRSKARFMKAEFECSLFISASIFNVYIIQPREKHHELERHKMKERNKPE